MKRITFTLMLLTVYAGLFATSERKQLQLQIAAQYGLYDRTTIYFDFGLSPAYNADEDAAKVINTLPGSPNIYSLTSDDVKCEIIGYSPLTQSAVIGLGLQIDSSVLYTFSLQQLDNFDSTTLVVLEDRKLNVFTELHVNLYQVQLTPQDTTGRFFLHVTSAVQFNPVTAGCSNNDGAIVVSADSAITWNSASLSDSNGVITSYSNARGQFTFSGLGEKNYQVVLNYDGYTATKNIFLPGKYIHVSISASPQTVELGQTIDFFSSAINTTDYVWQFGDSSIETGVENPSFLYYITGNFTVTLTCTNTAGCSAQAQTLVTVTESTGINTPESKGVSIINIGAKTVQVIMNNQVLNNAELDVYNILGQQIYASPVTSGQMQVSLENNPAGIYLVTVRNGSKSTTAKIYIN